jgi:histidinol-phosphate aminotransferase
LNEIDKTRLPYNINVLTQASARFALQHVDVLLKQANQIRNDRAWLIERLTSLGTLTVYPSEANFILFRTPEGQATDLFNRLREQGVLVKNLSPAGGQLADCLRVTVGTAQENKVFVDMLTQIMQG